MNPALSSPIAKLQNMVGEGIGKTAEAVGARLRNYSNDDSILKAHEKRMAEEASQPGKEVITGIASGEGYIDKSPRKSGTEKAKEDEYREPVEGLPWLDEDQGNNNNNNNAQPKPNAGQKGATAQGSANLGLSEAFMKMAGLEGYDSPHTTEQPNKTPQGLVINADTIKPETMATIQGGAFFSKR